jgi:hypothetical protein
MKPPRKTGKCQRCGRRSPVAWLMKVGQGAMQRRLCIGCRSGFLPFATGLRSPTM